MAKKTGKHTSPRSAGCMVLPQIYLGPWSAASASAFLTSAGITHILSIGKTPAVAFPDITYTRIALVDAPTSSITRAVETAITCIDNAVNKKRGKIYIHCAGGVSRSPTILAAYLLKREGYTLREALRVIVRARPVVSPNSGFLRQLKEMEIELFGESTVDFDELPAKWADDPQKLYALEGG